MRSVNQVYERLKTQMSPLPAFSEEKGEDRYRSQIDLRGCSFCVCVPCACFWHFTLSSVSLHYALCVAHFCQCPRYQNSLLIRRKPQPHLAQTPRTATKKVLFLRNCWHSSTSQASKMGSPSEPVQPLASLTRWHISWARLYPCKIAHWSSLQIFIQFKTHGVTDCINCTWSYSSAVTDSDLKMISCTVIPEKKAMLLVQSHLTALQLMCAILKGQFTQKSNLIYPLPVVLFI